MVLRFREFELDEARRTLSRHGRRIEVGQLGFDLLLYLIKCRDRVVSKDELVSEVWAGRDLSASAVPTAINALRKTLFDSASEPSLIQTIYGHGYRWLEQVVESKSGETVPFDAASRDFVGRRDELRVVEQMLEGVERPDLAAAVAIGAAGIGKSRFLDECIKAARRRGYRIGTGRSWETPGAPALNPWKEVLEDIGVGGLADLIDGLRAHPGDSAESAGAAQYELLREVAGAVESAAEEQPVLLAFDDLHCADHPTLLLLDSMIREVRPKGVRFVATLRPIGSRRRAGEILAALARSTNTIHLEMIGFSPSESREFVRERARFSLSDRLLETLVSRSSGNPLFLEQLVQQLNVADGGAGEDELVREALRISPSLRRAVEAGLTAITPEARHVLQAGSVLGRDFSLDAVTRLLGLPCDEAMAHLNCAIDNEIVRHRGVAGPFRFAHVLYRDALYEGLSHDERVRMHREALAFLRERHGSLIGDVACVAARHSVALPAEEGADESVALLEEAARWSETHLGFEEAADYLLSALDVLERSPVAGAHTRIEILIRLGGAQRRAGDPEAAAATFRQAVHLARLIDEPRLLAEAALGYAPGFFAIEAGVVDESLIEMLDEALRCADRSAEPALCARLMGRLAMALYWSEQDEARSRLSEEAVALAELSGDPNSKAFAVTAREVARWGPEGAAGRAELAEWAVELASESGDLETELVYRLYRLTSLLQIGEFAQVWKELELFSRRSVTSLHRGALWYRDLFGALRAMIEGDWVQAEELAGSFVDLGRSVRDRNAENCAVIHAAYRNIEYGSEETARILIEQQAVKFPRVRSYECGRAFLAAACGDIEEARRRLRGLIAAGELKLSKTVEWLISVALLSETCVLLKDRRRSRVLYDALKPHEDEFVVVVFSVAVWRPVSYFLARLASVIGELEESERLFEKARAVSEDLGARPWVAHCLFGHAELLRSRAWPGDGRMARELALQAEELGTDLSMDPLLLRVRRFLWGPRGRRVPA